MSTALTLVDLARIVVRNGSRGAIVGLDVGRRNVGLALSDPTCAHAAAWTVHSMRSGADFGRSAKGLAQLIASRRPMALVVGYPMIDGGDSTGCLRVRQFLADMQRSAPLGVPYMLWDESGSSARARAQVSHLRAPPDKIDGVAAQLILQGALDALAALLHAGKGPGGRR